MEKIINLIFENGKYKIALSTLGIGFALQALLITYYLPEFLHYSGNIKKPDQLFTYNVDYVVYLYQKLGNEGRKFYIKMLIVDFFYTSIAGIAYSLLLATLVKKRKWYIILPLVLTISDIIENTFQIGLLNSFPKITSLGVALSSLFSSIKMIGGAIILSLLLFHISKNLLNWIKNKNSVA